MKTSVVSLLALFAMSNCFAQNTKEEVLQTTTVKETLTFLGVSKPMSSLGDPSVELEQHESHDAKKNGAFDQPEPLSPALMPQELDPIIQKEFGSFPSKSAIVSWDGLGGASPPDPSGAAGPNHYVQAVNTKYRVYSKTGAGLMAAANLSSLWPGSTNDGDPIVMYDRFADRWFIAQFQQTGNKVLVAISTTPNPLGTYYLYEKAFNSFPDYFKFSIWSDGYYMSCNKASQNVAVWERAKMLVGDNSAAILTASLPTMSTHYGFRSALPADADGVLPPIGTPCYYFYFQDNGWAGSPGDQIRIMKFQADFVTPANTTFTAVQTLLPPAFNSVFNTSWNDIVQKNSTTKIDAIASIFTYRAQYMRWVGYNSVILTNVVDVDGNTTAGTSTAGIRWYQLRQDDATGVWSIYDQGTYAPSDSQNRFIASAALDNQGNMGMGFNLSGTNHFPSIAYTGRYATDPLGQMTVAESIVTAGVSSQEGFNRFGDYSHMSLDPDGKTFWFTGEYIGASGSRKSRIFSFDLQANLSSQQLPYYTSEFNAFFQNGKINASISKANYTEKIQFELFDVSGRLIETIQSGILNENASVQFDASSLNSGMYVVRVGNANFARTLKIAF